MTSYNRSTSEPSQQQNDSAAGAGNIVIERPARVYTAAAASTRALQRGFTPGYIRTRDGLPLAGDRFGYTFKWGQPPSYRLETLPAHTRFEGGEAGVQDEDEDEDEDEDVSVWHAGRELEEPTTSAMYLFYFGFLFPPLWLLGAFTLLKWLPERVPEVSSSPVPRSGGTEDGQRWRCLWSPESEIETGTGTGDEEACVEHREQLMQRVRRAEVKWARRCLWAYRVFVLCVVVACVTVWYLE